jgi:nicotinamide riboside kinase
MKIYFLGAHSTGKSTLCKYVSKKHNLPMIFETARSILSEFELNIDTLRCDLDIADKYQKDVFDRQLLEERKYPAFVSDRSALDVLAYSAQHARILPTLLAAPELQPYLDGLKAPGSILYFVRPIKATLRSDGVRESLTWEGVISIDAQIKLLLEMFGISYFQINTESMSERVKLIDSILAIHKDK